MMVMIYPVQFQTQENKNKEEILARFLEGDCELKSGLSYSWV